MFDKSSSLLLECGPELFIACLAPQILRAADPQGRRPSQLDV